MTHPAGDNWRQRREHVRESRVPVRANAPSRDYLSHRYVGLIWRGWLRPTRKKNCEISTIRPSSSLTSELRDSRRTCMSSRFMIVRR